MQKTDCWRYYAMFTPPKNSHSSGRSSTELLLHTFWTQDLPEYVGRPPALA